MPETADNIARDLSIGREQSDLFACRSQMNYRDALAAGFFSDEIVPVIAEDASGIKTAVALDEYPRPGTTVDNLAALKPLKKEGS